MSTVKPIPEGYHSIQPYLYIRGAAEAIDFYQRAFGATVRLRMARPDGRVGHAEIQLGDSVVMLTDEAPVRGIGQSAALRRVRHEPDVLCGRLRRGVSHAIAAGAENGGSPQRSVL